MAEAQLPSTEPDTSAVDIRHHLNNPPRNKHPPYATMIKEAIVAGNKSRGSSRQAIGNYIKSVYSNLPDSHKAQLNSNLKRLCRCGQIVKVKLSYRLSASETGYQRHRGSRSSRLAALAMENEQCVPIQVPFAEPKAVDESDVNEVEPISKRPRKCSFKIQKGKAFTRKAGNDDRLGPVQPRWSVSYDHVQFRLQVVQEQMKKILDGMKPHLVDKMARSSRLANALKELDQISSMNILAFPLHADEAQEQGGTAQCSHSKAQHLSSALGKSKPSPQRQPVSSNVEHSFVVQPSSTPLYRSSSSKDQCSLSSSRLPKPITKNKTQTASQVLQQVQQPHQQSVRHIQQEPFTQPPVQQKQSFLQALREQFMQLHPLKPTMQQPLRQHQNQQPFQQQQKYQQASHPQLGQREPQPYRLVFQPRPPRQDLQGQSQLLQQPQQPKQQ